MSTRPAIALEVTGRDCLVVGGGRRALKTVRHVLAHGAHVTIVAPRLHPELRTRLSEGAITHHATTFAPAQLRGMKIAFADTGDPVIDKAVCLAAAVRGIAAHCIDAEPLTRGHGTGGHVRAA